MPPDPAPASLLDLDDVGLAKVVGDPPYRLAQVKQWIYEHGVGSVSEMSNIPLATRDRLAEIGLGTASAIDEVTTDGGLTVKWLFRSGDAEYESVLMLYDDRATLCISSQAGCAQDCPFCATGQGGFARQLSTGEIIEQVLFARRWLAQHQVGDVPRPRRVSNVVLMGMGEPLANYANVVAAVNRINRDCQIAARSITVSTIGIPYRIRRLAHDVGQITLAWSLHAVDDELRNRLVPPNRRWPIAAVADAIRDYRSNGGRRVTIEYTMMRDINDSTDEASKLIPLARDLGAHVNLIPMNTTGNPTYRPSDPETIAQFAAVLVGAGVNATVRHNRGSDANAACGQLRARAKRLTLSTRKTEPTTGTT